TEPEHAHAGAREPERPRVRVRCVGFFLMGGFGRGGFLAHGITGGCRTRTDRIEAWERGRAQRPGPGKRTPPWRGSWHPDYPHRLFGPPSWPWGRRLGRSGREGG